MNAFCDHRNPESFRIVERVKDYVLVLKFTVKTKKDGSKGVIYSSLKIQRFRGTAEELMQVNKWHTTYPCEVEIPADIDPLVAMLFIAGRNSSELFTAKPIEAVVVKTTEK